DASAIRRFATGSAFDFDELHFYAHRLSETEALNRYHAVIDPDKLAPPEKPAPIDLNAWRLPAANTLHYQMKPSPGHEAIASAELVLVDAAGQTVFRAQGTVDGNRHALSLPALKPGRYALRAIVEDENSALESSPIIIEAEHFAWEGNALGETDEVFPPFEPVRADTSGRVSVVQRTYHMNGFGLWDSVQSQSRELLARPVELRYRTAAGREGVWKTEAPALDAHGPQRAVYRARAVSDAVVVETRSEVEVAGMMKVTLRLSPGAKPEPIAALWLDVPLKASEARLMHEDTGSLRSNYSGLIPSGAGTVWKSDRDTRWPWRNAFTGYVWIGGEDRGVAWFAENDKGWVTEKGLSDKPLQEIVRADGEVAIRVNLVNVPVTLTEPRELVFGLQASPAKPVPEDWRTGPRGGGLPVTPWGGHQCADKFPFDDRWEIVDQIIHFQTNRTDRDTVAAWFAQYRDAHDVPPVRGVSDWVKDCVHFASRSERPVLVYFEEMAAPTYRRDWHVYKDEWSRNLLAPRQTWPDGYDLFRQGTPESAAIRVNFIDSYRDYGLHYANEWLKRGVGIYWDNTVLTTSLNPLTSEAYLAEDGSIQPALTLWNQREYSRRMWTLTRQWERKRGERLIFLQHMTNTHLLPILAWADTAFDNEWSPDRFARVFPERQKPDEPYPPEFLRAQSTGRQSGCYPALCHGLFRLEQFKVPAQLIPSREMDAPDNIESSIYAQKREWGMARVHEIPARQGWLPASAKLEHALSSFGYGTPAVAVHNYWAERPALQVDDPETKWLLLARPADRRLMVVLQSWSRAPRAIQAKLDFDVIGFRPDPVVVESETGAELQTIPGGFALRQTSAYDFRMLAIGVSPPAKNVLLDEAFEDGVGLLWTSGVQGANRVVVGGRHVYRFGVNPAPWQGPLRLEKWDGVAGWEDGVLSMSFRLSKVPRAKTELLTVVTRATAPNWSQHGLSHTLLKDGQFLRILANPETGSCELERSVVDAGGRTDGRATAAVAGLDTEPHVLTITLDGGTTRIALDGRECAVFDDTPATGAAFGIRGARNPNDELHVDVSRITFERKP
ncbi:MAG: DUF6067 family protein, partial [Kiritimatiellae bacterium]|nr:DUF6067 family protein [Kiritimatiellia bacterium]